MCGVCVCVWNFHNKYIYHFKGTLNQNISESEPVYITPTCHSLCLSIFCTYLSSQSSQSLCAAVTLSYINSTAKPRRSHQWTRVFYFSLYAWIIHKLSIWAAPPQRIFILKLRLFLYTQIEFELYTKEDVEEICIELSRKNDDAAAPPLPPRPK